MHRRIRRSLVLSTPLTEEHIMKRYALTALNILVLIVFGHDMGL